MALGGYSPVRTTILTYGMRSLNPQDAVFQPQFGNSGCRDGSLGVRISPFTIPTYAIGSLKRGFAILNYRGVCFNHRMAIITYRGISGGAHLSCFTILAAGMANLNPWCRIFKLPFYNSELRGGCLNLRMGYPNSRFEILTYYWMDT
jgi:hypothetical protein